MSPHISRFHWIQICGSYRQCLFVIQENWSPFGADFASNESVLPTFWLHRRTKQKRRRILIIKYQSNPKVRSERQLEEVESKWPTSVPSKRHQQRTGTCGLWRNLLDGWISPVGKTVPKQIIAASLTWATERPARPCVFSTIPWCHTLSVDIFGRYKAPFRNTSIRLSNV